MTGCKGLMTLDLGPDVDDTRSMLGPDVDDTRSMLGPDDE